MCLSPDEMNEPELDLLIGRYEAAAATDKFYAEYLVQLRELRATRFPTVIVEETGESLVYSVVTETIPRRGYSRAA